MAALWDLGLEPGHSVRTLEDCEREARRHHRRDGAAGIALAGRQPHAHEAPGQRHAGTAGRGGVLPGQAGGDAAAPRPLPGPRPYALEPNCKESPGGLRDLQVILWMARAAGFGHSWREVAQAGLLTSSEARDLRRAEQAFKRLRIETAPADGPARRPRPVRPATGPGRGLWHCVDGDAAARQRTADAALLLGRALVTQLNVILVQNIEERLFPRPDSDARLIDDDFRNLRERLDIVRERMASSAIRRCCCAPSW